MIKSNDYKHLFLEGKARFNGAAIEQEARAFSLKVESVKTSDDLYETQKIELCLPLTAEQITHLKGQNPEIPQDTDTVTFLAKPDLLKKVRVSQATTHRELLKTYQHLLFDLTQYTWWQATSSSTGLSYGEDSALN